MATDDRGVHIHVGDHVGQDKAGGDQTTVGDIAGTGVAVGRRASTGQEGRRRMDDNDLLTTLNELQRQLHNLNTEVALLKFQVSQLNDRLRTPSTFGQAQWWIVLLISAAATALATSMVLRTLP